MSTPGRGGLQGTLDALGIAGASDVSSFGREFTSGGRPVRLEYFVPPGEGPHPAAVVLHGAGGIDAGNRYVRRFAEGIAAQGLATVLVHYFDRTGTTYAGDATIHREFADWLETVGEAIGAVAAEPVVDASRLALLGYSLGGYLAMAQAARDARLRAVIELAGGIDAESAAKAQRFPPTFIVHGREDRRVPFTEALNAEKIVRATGAEVETHYCDGEGHILSGVCALQALAAILAFLERHLAVTESAA